MLGESEIPVTVLSVAARYGMADPAEAWTRDADFRADTPQQVVALVEELEG
jgi:hypothetical protein